MAAAADEERECSLYKSKPWSPRIPQVVPGRDYVAIPANADEGPAWSLLVGVMSAGALRLHRFRVASSGRISGRTDSMLQIFHDLGKPPGCCWSAYAALAPDGRSLCVIEQVEDEPTQALQLQLQTDQSQTEELPAEARPLPPLDPSVRGRFMPIAADGQLWAVSAFSSSATSFRLVLQRLVIQEDEGEDSAGRSRSCWEHVGTPYIHPSLPARRWDGGFLQGYAVLPGLGADGGTLILLSLDNTLFFTLDLSAPDSGWTQVLTDDPSHEVYFYIPIIGRGVYVQENNAVYMICGYNIYAYTLSLEEEEEEDGDGPKRKTRLKLKPPLPVDSACPSIGGQGHSFLAHLGGRLMCSVWISVRLRCPCDHLHAIVTTFHLRPSDIGGVEMVHATCRRLHLLPMEHDHEHEFSFLQEYKDDKVLLQHGEEEEDDPIIPASPEMLDVISFDSLIQKGLTITSLPCPVVRVKPAAIHKDLFVICQAGLQSFIYKLDKFNVMDWSAIERARLGRRFARDDDAKPLEPHYIVPAHEGHRHMLNDQPPPQWHFVRGSSSELYAVSCIDDGMRVVDLDKRRHTFALRPVDPFVMAIRVGGVTVALTDTLQVYQLKACPAASTSWSWVRCKADHSHVLDRKIKLSGYAAVGDDSFIVCDAITCSCLLFDMGTKQWRVVMSSRPLKEYHMPMTMPRNRLLNGRCVFVEGFIYTCVDDGLAAYELLWEDHHSVFLSYPIRLLPSSWDGTSFWCRGRMCLDYAGINTDSGAIFFSVVQGETNILHIATVQIKTEKTTSNKMKPVGIHQVVRVTRSIYRGERTTYEKLLCSGPYLLPYYTNIFSCASE